MFLVAGIGLTRLFRDLRWLLLIVHGSFVLRRYKKIAIYASIIEVFFVVITGLPLISEIPMTPELSES